jgi:hypothetical protein
MRRCDAEGVAWPRLGWREPGLGGASALRAMVRWSRGVLAAPYWVCAAPFGRDHLGVLEDVRGWEAGFVRIHATHATVRAHLAERPARPLP